MNASPSFEQEQSLCLDCGLCCSGVVLSGVRLSDSERQRASRLNLNVIETPRGPAFSLPCPKLTGNACGIYQLRPEACVAYRCKLLQCVATGSLTLNEARCRVHELLDILGVIRQLIGETQMPEFLRLAAHAADPATSTVLREKLLSSMGEATSYWLTLRSLLDEWVNSPGELMQRQNVTDPR